MGRTPALHLNHPVDSKLSPAAYPLLDLTIGAVL
jgi:hypothetical protein